MPSLNRVVLLGRLTKDVELRYTASGKPVGNFTLAVDRSFQNAEGKKEVDFICCVVWGKLAENCSNYIGKGSLVAMEGRLQVRSYQTSEGQNRITTEVVAENVQFLDRKKEQSGDNYDPPEDQTNLGELGDDPPF